MNKVFEGLCSFLLFGSAATGLIMVFVLVAEFELEKWGVAPAGSINDMHINLSFILGLVSQT